MKYQTLLLLWFAISATAAKLNKKELKKINKECEAEVGINLKEMRAVAKTDVYASEKLFKSHDFKCFLKCLFIKRGLMSYRGLANFEEIKETFKISESKLESVTDCIKRHQSNDLCERAYTTRHCIYFGRMK